MPDYTIRGADGKDYPAEAGSLKAFAIDGRVAPETMVYDHAAKNWVRADSIPGLTFAPPRVGVAAVAANRPSAPKAFGCLASVLCLLVFLFLTLNNGSSMLMLLSFCFALAFGIIGVVQIARK